MSPWLVAALLAEAGLAVADASTNETFTAIYLLPPLALALFEQTRRVTIVAAIAIALGIASGVWNDHFFTLGHLVRASIVAVGGVLAVLSAQARTALAESRRKAEATGRRLDAMLGALAEAVTVHDEHGQTVYANDAAVRLLGAESLAEILSTRPGELAARFLMTREDGTLVRAEDYPGRQVVAGEPAEPLLTRSVLLATGESRWLLTKATVVHDERGRPLAVNVIEDVTEAKEAELRQRFLSGATQLLARSLDLDETLQQIAWLAVPSLADWCSVDLVDRGEIERVALAHHDPDKLALGLQLGREYPPDLDASAGLGAVVRSGEAAIFPEVTEEMIAAGARDARHAELVRSLGMRSAMVVPMRVAGAAIGAITFVNAESGRSFDADDLAFAEELTARAATAVEKARVYTRLADTAATLQQSLLPDQLAQPPGFSVAASYRAGERGTEVGGDFYDLFPVGDGWMVLLGDVTGKGVKAAALTALVRHTAKTAARFDSRPANVARLLNEVLREQPELSIVTALLARVRLTPDGAQVEIVSAGHPKPLRVGGGRVEAIGHHDVVLGAVDVGEWTESRATIGPGQTLLFYTDGVTEMPGANDRFGDERLIAALADGPSAAADVIERVERRLQEFQAGELADDRAMLAIELVAVTEPAGLTAR
jgi:PAS domain S-box-containing protein